MFGRLLILSIYLLGTYVVPLVHHSVHHLPSSNCSTCVCSCGCEHVSPFTAYREKIEAEYGAFEVGSAPSFPLCKSHCPFCQARSLTFVSWQNDFSRFENFTVEPAQSVTHWIEPVSETLQFHPGPRGPPYA
jgi:hypothetical protein